MSFRGRIAEGTFLERPNRFVVWVEVDGQPVKAHCPTSGRIGELTVPGTRMLVRQRPDARPDQATRWSLVAGQHHGTWVIVDTHKVNALVAHGLENGVLEDRFPGLTGLQREPASAGGRFDFALATEAGEVMVEAKSVTLLDEEDLVTGRFPDAPTARGRRHVQELTERARQGRASAILFVAMRSDIQQVAPNWRTDPAFGHGLIEAREAGVQVIAWGTGFEDGQLWLTEQLPVNLDPP